MSNSMESAITSAESRAATAIAVAQETIDAVRRAAEVASGGTIFTAGVLAAKKEAEVAAAAEATIVVGPSTSTSGLFNSVAGIADKSGAGPGETTPSGAVIDYNSRAFFDLSSLGGAAGDPLLDSADQLVNITTALQTTADEIGLKFSLDNLNSYLFVPASDISSGEQVYKPPVYGVLDITSAAPDIGPTEDLELPDTVVPEGWLSYEGVSKGSKPEVDIYESPLYSMDFGGVAPSRSLDESLYDAFFLAYENATKDLTVPAVSYIVPEYTKFTYSELGQTELDSQLASMGGVSTLLQSIVDPMSGSGLAGVVPESQFQKTFEQSRDREAGIYKNVLSRVHHNFAARGFKLIQPASSAQLSVAALEYAKALSGVNRAVTLERMKMHSDICKFAISSQIEVGKLVLDYVDKVATRALLAAEKAANYQIAYYNLRSALYKLEVESVVSASGIARSILSDNLQRLEVFKASFAELDNNKDNIRLSLEASKAAANTEQLLVEQYKADIEKSRLQLAYSTAALDLEKLTVSKFSALSAVAAQKTLSDIQVEDLKIKAYRTSSDVEFQSAKIANQVSETELAKARLELDAVKSTYERSVLQAEVAKTQLDVGVADANRLIGIVNANAAQYTAGVDPMIQSNSALLTFESSNNELRSERAKLAVVKDRINREFELQGRKLAVDAATAGIPLASSMVTSALNGIGVITSQASW